MNGDFTVRQCYSACWSNNSPGATFCEVRLSGGLWLTVIGRVVVNVCTIVVSLRLGQHYDVCVITDIDVGCLNRQYS